MDITQLKQNKGDIIMRFIEYINERELIFKELSRDKAMKLIEKNCLEILSFYNSNPNIRLYRRNRF